MSVRFFCSASTQWKRIVTQVLWTLAATLAVSAQPATNGPTLHLDYGHGDTNGSPVAEFMYFVPLISPDLVSLRKSDGNSQRARILSLTRRDSTKSFLVTCEVEFVGEGFQRNAFDLTRNINRHESSLKAGKNLERQLDSINVEGAGRLKIEVEGTLKDGVRTVNEVRLHFNAHSHTSPVSIGLHDVRYRDGVFEPCNELVARVNTLTFRRQSGPPKMEVTVASVKRAGAGNNLWQNFVGGLKGAAVNMLIQPLTVERIGHNSMLEFGKALAEETPEFTFPKARNLKTEP